MSNLRLRPVAAATFEDFSARCLRATWPAGGTTSSAPSPRASRSSAIYESLDDGTIRDLHTIAQPELHGEGRVVAVVGTTMDVTQWRRAERALQRARARMLKARYAAMLAEA